MPVGRCEDEHRRPFPLPDLCIGGGDSFLHRGDLDALAFVVELAEPRGDHQRLVLIVQRQQFGAERRIANPAAGIDPGADDEPHVIGVHRAVQPAGQRQRGDALVLAPARRLQPTLHESAVQPLEWYHIADRRKAGEVDQPHQVGQTLIAAQPQRPVDRDEDHEGDTRGAQIAQPRNVVRPVRIDDGRRLGELVIAEMMVDHHHVGAARPRMCDRLIAHRAAVERQDQAGAGVDQPVHRSDRRAVAFEDAIGDIHQWVEAEVPEVAGDERT